MYQWGGFHCYWDNLATYSTYWSLFHACKLFEAWSTHHISTNSVSLIHLLPFEERAWERGYRSVNKVLAQCWEELLNSRFWASIASWVNLPKYPIECHLNLRFFKVTTMGRGLAGRETWGLQHWLRMHGFSNDWSSANFRKRDSRSKHTSQLEQHAQSTVWIMYLAPTCLHPCAEM